MIICSVGRCPEKTNINHLEFLISDTDFTKTAKITILPPINVHCEGTSLMKSQTQMGPKVNSNNIKRVNSAAKRCFDAIIKSVFTVADKRPPRTKQSSKSLSEMFKLSRRRINAIIITTPLDNIKVGNISNLRL